MHASPVASSPCPRTSAWPSRTCGRRSSGATPASATSAPTVGRPARPDRHRPGAAAARTRPGRPGWLRLRGPNLWPAALPELRAARHGVDGPLEALGQSLLRALAPPSSCRPRHVRRRRSPRPRSCSRSSATPPADARARRRPARASAPTATPASSRSCTRTTSAGCRSSGTAADRRDATPGALVVNIGEMFQLVTRGYYKATVHRVVSPPPGVERISFAYFFNPQLEATLTPVDLPAAPRRPRPRWRERRPGQPDPRQLRRQLAEGAPARPSRRGRRPPRRSARRRAPWAADGATPIRARRPVRHGAVGGTPAP